MRKVVGATLGAAVATIIIWLIGLTGIEFSDAVAAAIVTVVTFLVGYFVPSSTADLPRALTYQMPPAEASASSKGQSDVPPVFGDRDEPPA